MEEDAIVDESQNSPLEGSGDQSGTGTPTPERTMIQLPADKFRDMRRELTTLRSQIRESNQTPSNRPTLSEEAQNTLDLIRDSVSQPINQELRAIRDEMDSLALERLLSDVDTRVAPFRDEFNEELRKLAVENPNLSPAELVEQSENRAAVRAWRNGTLNTYAEDSAEERVITRSRLASPAKGSASPRGQRPETFDPIGDNLSYEDRQVAARKIVEAGKVNELFSQSQGRAPRR